MAKSIGAIIRWLLKGCKGNLFRDYLNNADKENEDLIIGIIAALLLTGLGIILVKYNLF